MKFKLLRLSLLSILVMLGGMTFAQDETIDFTALGFENAQEVTEVNGTDVTLTLDKGTNSNAPKYYNTGTALRLYGSNTLTVSSSTKTVEKVVFTFSSASNTLENPTVSEGSYDSETSTWTGSSSNFTITRGGTSGHARIQKMEFYFASGSDTRTVTTVTVGGDQTGTAGSNMNLPLAVVKDASGNTLSGAAVTWSSNNEAVAAVDGTVLSLLTAGVATITATFAGDDSYKGSSASFKVTVTAAAVEGAFTSLKALQEAVTATSTPVTIQFNDAFVTAVKGSNAYLADADGYGILIYQKNHGLEAGQVLNGTIEANLLLYKGQTEITGFSKDGLTITTTELTPAEKTIGAITAANQSTLVTLKGVTFSDGKLSDGTNEITYYDNFNAGGLEEGATYDITGIVIVFNNTLEIAPRTADDIVKTSSGGEQVDQRQELTLTFPQTSYEATMGEDFVEPVLSGVPEDFDGTMVYSSSNGEVATVGMEGEIYLQGPGTTDITAEATFSHLYKGSATYTLTVKAAGGTPVEPGELANPYSYTFEQKVFDAKSQTQTLNSANWTLDVTCNDADGYFGYDGNKGQQFGSGNKPATAITLSTADIPGTITKIVVNTSGANSINATFGVKVGDTDFMCEDATTATLTNTATDYTFTGSAAGTITISWANNSSKAIYVKSINVEYATEEQPVTPAEFQDFAVIVNNQDGTLLTSEEQVQGTEVTFGVAVDEAGNTVRVAADDASSFATVSGKYHSEHGMTGLKVVTAVPGAVKILVGKCTYSTNTITVTNSAGEKVIEYTPQGEQGSGDLVCWKNDRSNVMELVYNGEPTTLTITGMSYCPFVEVKEYVAPAEFQDFAVIVNNQDGTLLTSEEQVQGTEVTFGVAVDEDGKTVRVAADDASSFATVSGKYHSEHGMTGLKVVTAVPGAVKILVGKCTYSTNTITVTNSNGEKVIEYTPQGEQGSGDLVCWKNDRSNVMELVYDGEPTTLTITGMSYCPFVAVEKTEVEPTPVSQDITGTWDFADANVMTATMALSGSEEAGQVKDVEDNGLMMTVMPNNATFRNNGDNIQVRSGAEFRIPVKNAGDLVTVKGYPGYSYYTINDGAEITNTNDNPKTEYKAKPSDAERGYVAVISTNDNNYYLSLSVVQYAPKEKITLDNELATIEFPFNEGTEGQKATFSNADYFLNSKVTHGDNWSIQDSQVYADLKQTRLTPVDQHNSDLTDADAVRFLFTPKPGFIFTPTKVSFKTNRFGTDNGLIDAYWQNADGTTVELEKEIKPERNNSGVYTAKAYDITGATPGEGTCGLKLFLYHLQATKQIGLADIVIEGTLSGTEKDVPVLASFKVNGNEYAVEDVFGEAFEATLELSNAETMVGPGNPLTDVTAKSGEVGTLAYDVKDNACTVTIPMTAGDTQMDYVLNVAFKPYFTLSYIDVEGAELGTQTVEKDAAIGQFAYDIADVPATKEGYKARGWFKSGVLGEKFTTADIITADTKLYAIQTETEVSSTHKKYFFDLADKFFDPEDHEAFNPAGDGFYWHDDRHGWAFKNGNTVDLLVGPKATITVTLCQYGSGTGIAVKKNGETLATIDGIAEGDGGTAVYNYEGEAGTLTLEMQCGGEMYIHAMKIVNTAEVNFESQGNWYFVKAGDAGSLIDVIDVVNGVNASTEAERSFIFLPDGTYDLDATVKTAITGHNISIIGQSMDKTIIVTKPDKSLEGLGKADLLDVSGTNLYMQDLTLQNALDYYSAGSAGRAAAIQDAGNRTIAKNVRLLSYQDTYYSSNNSQQAYWETCDIHGTVDFICGGGDVRFQDTKISLEPRALDGKGSRTITAATTSTPFGYVFDGCNIVDLAEGKGSWNFGRTWQNEPICVFLNTTLDEGAKNTLIATRWIEKGMNNKDPQLFGEYGTKDIAGNDITPASNTINSFGGAFETIIAEAQAATFSYERMFTSWDPKTLAAQTAAPANASYDNGVVSWNAVDGAIAYALFKNGEFVAIVTDGTSFNLQKAETDEVTIRSANSRGGFGEAAQVNDVTVGISSLDKQTVAPSDSYYDLSGRKIANGQLQRGVYIINGKKVVK